MELIIEKNQLDTSPVLFLRKAGYSAVISRKDKDDSYTRRISSGKYPCFHIYFQETTEQIIFNLHLDQKQPSYPGSRAHSGEYEGELVAEEITRLKSLI